VYGIEMMGDDDGMEQEFSIKADERKTVARAMPVDCIIPGYVY
jgi:hypothetical protein